VVVLASPFDSIGTLAFVVGIWLIVIGVMEVVTAIAIRRTTHQVKSDITREGVVHESTEPMPGKSEETTA
jgi:hypothetical protein